MWALMCVPQPNNNQFYLFPARIAPRYQNSFSPGNFPGYRREHLYQATNYFIVQVIQDTWETLYLHGACLHSVMQEIAQAPEPEAI